MNPGDTEFPEIASNRWCALNEGRGVNPGDTYVSPRGWRTATALNEGRGVNPGDTRAVELTFVRLNRSTKAGA